MLQVFYSPAQTARENQSFSPSAEKPGKIVAEIAGMPEITLVGDWAPLTVEELSVAHDRDHVEAILGGRKANGFGNTLSAVAETLPWTNGSFYHAAVDAVRRGTATFSPTSGFHHAEFAEAMGFCTFNGLMIAAILMHHRGIAERIGIVDLDVHYGNGTEDIIRRRGIDYVRHLSFGDLGDRNGVWSRRSSGGARGSSSPTDDPESGDPWVDSLRRRLHADFADRDILFYQAGADPHVEDPLGGALTTEQMRLRDRTVFRFAAAEGIPIVWNLAGGYQRPVDRVIGLHLNTLQECLDAFFR